MPKENLLGVYPDAFRAKLDSALVILSGTPSGTTILVCNAFRVDAKADAIDQEPFGVLVSPSGASTGGLFLHHGDWPERTVTPPAGFWDFVSASGVGNYFYANPPSGVTQGPLETLPGGHAEAFRRVVDHLSSGSH